MQILQEHNTSPGTVYDNLLMYDGFGAVLNEMVDLHEAAGSNNTLKFRGKFQEAEAVNKNKRMYPFGVLDSNIKRLEESLNGGLCGELDHPSDSIVHFSNVSHKITKLWWENNVLMGEGVILNTPHGKILRSLINDGVRIGISSRGVGNGKVNESGVLVIGESYKLITFDAVADPSTYSAFQKKVTSHKENVNNFDENINKNEAPGVNTKTTINKELLIACIGGIVHKKSNDIKARLT